MRPTDLREAIVKLRIPNAVAVLGILGIIYVPLAIIFALSAGKNAAEGVQIIYQLALVLAGTVGLPLAIWRSWTAHRQAITGQEQLKGLQRQIAIAEAGADADRILKGSEMLAGESVAVRFAGIAILREIASSDLHRYRKEAGAVLVAFGKDLSNKHYRDSLNYDASPADLVECFTALNKLKLEGDESSGRFAICHASMSLGKASQYSLYGTMMRDCMINTTEISSVSGWNFYNCDFYNCKIHTENFDLNTYTNCEFVDCKFTGGIDGEIFTKCKFVRCENGGKLMFSLNAADIKAQFAV